jgi:hypothetical protein
MLLLPPFTQLYGAAATAGVTDDQVPETATPEVISDNRELQSRRFLPDHP